MPDRFARVIVANTALPTGGQPLGEAFAAWRRFSQEVPGFRAGRIVYGGTVSKLTEDEVAAYDAPFPDDRYKAGARQSPLLVPDRTDDPESEPNRQAWKVIRGLQTPVLTDFGAEDRIMAGVDGIFQKLCPGVVGQNQIVLPKAGRFLQEDVPQKFAQMVLAFIRETA